MRVAARLLRRNWILVAIFALMGAAGIALAAYGITWGFFPAWFGTLFAPIFVARNAFPRALPTMVNASSERVQIEGVTDILAEDVVEAKVVPYGAKHAVVTLSLPTGNIALRLGAAEAHQLVSLLGARRARFTVIIPFWKRFLAVAAIGGVLFLVLSRGDVGFWVATLPFTFFFATFAAWIAGFLRGRVVIGTDGFATQWLFLRRFVPFRDVARVNTSWAFLGGRSDTLVVMNSSKSLRLRAVDAPNTDAERGAEARALHQHLLDAFQRSKRVLATAEIRSLVERGSRTAEDWLAALDELARGRGRGYRSAVVSPDVLEEVATDPTAAAEARLGAAAALVRVSDEATRTRVRVSAEACAEPELREALLAVADAHDDEAALSALGTLRARR